MTNEPNLVGDTERQARDMRLVECPQTSDAAELEVTFYGNSLKRAEHELQRCTETRREAARRAGEELAYRQRATNANVQRAEAAWELAQRQQVTEAETQRLVAEEARAWVEPEQAQTNAATAMNKAPRRKTAADADATEAERARLAEEQQRLAAETEAQCRAAAEDTETEHRNGMAKLRCEAAKASVARSGTLERQQGRVEHAQRVAQAHFKALESAHEDLAALQPADAEAARLQHKANKARRRTVKDESRRGAPISNSSDNRDAVNGACSSLGSRGAVRPEDQEEAGLNGQDLSTAKRTLADEQHKASAQMALVLALHVSEVVTLKAAAQQGQMAGLVDTELDAAMATLARLEKVAQ